MSYIDQILSQFGYKSYEEYQREEKNMRYDILGEWQYKFATQLRDVFSLKPGYKVLEIGCASGNLLRALKEVAGIEGYGIEIDKAMVEKSPYIEEIKIIHDEAKNLRKHFEDSFFDFIYSIQVFEHFNGLDYSEKVLKVIFNILKPESLVYISAVFGEHLSLDDLRKMRDKGEDVDITHINIWPYEVWKDLSEGVGFKVVTPIIQPVFDSFYFKDGSSFLLDCSWHQIFLYKGDNIKKLERDMSHKLNHILVQQRPPREVIRRVLEREEISEIARKRLNLYLESID